MWHSKNVKKKHSDRGNYWEDSWQRNYRDGQTSNMTKNIGVGWKETGGDGRARDLQKERQ